ncbi:MAG TPA: thermonuclease family protein [Solirubrobacterales bacterium]|nr:thermonuclease family protein [Solirubrobacterales bacterium]
MDSFWPRRGQLGSAALLVAVALILLRPWEGGDEGGPAAVRARVVRVVDGDTIAVRTGGRNEDVRYIGVDTPETVDPERPVQCFGHRAAAFNRHLVADRRVRLVFGAERRDAYGRLLAYVYIRHRFVNAELLRRGLARTLAIAPNTHYQAVFARLELAAARSGRGLWGSCRP